MHFAVSEAFFVVERMAKRGYRRVSRVWLQVYAGNCAAILGFGWPSR